MDKLDEHHIREIVREEIKKIFTENDLNNVFDITKIPIEDLRKCYRDLRLDATPTTFDDLPTVNEAVGNIMPPDDVVKKIMNKFNLPESMVQMVESNHKIYIYIITAVIGINDKIIEEEMAKYGYFIGYKSEYQTISGMTYQRLQFEPQSQIQRDETDNIKKENKYLYHWTPLYNLDSIIKEGLIPSSKNEHFSFPNRVYLILEHSDDYKIYDFGQRLALNNTNPNNNGKYVLLEVELEKLDDTIRFFYDPNSDIGVYTEQKIPSYAIKPETMILFHTKLKR